MVTHAQTCSKNVLEKEQEEVKPYELLPLELNTVLRWTLAIISVVKYFKNIF